jgi:hypothetical protein
MDLQRLNKNMETSSKRTPTPLGVVIGTTKWDAETAPMANKKARELQLQAKFSIESFWKIITEIQQSPCSMTQEEFRAALEGSSQSKGGLCPS